MTPAILALAILTSVRFPVTTSDAGAQALINRGLSYYYAYDGGDAAGAFAAAAASDPHLAMAYWGEALANGPDLNTQMTAERFVRGQLAAQKSVALQAGIAPSERAYVDAMAQRYKGTWDDWAADDSAYRAAMVRIAGAPQAGDDARVLAAEALLEHGTLAWDGAHLATADSRHALALIAGVLARDPGNVMANHLCIHAYDDAPDRTPALSCAQRLDAASFAPQAEHLAHMPAHYWIETGNYAAALASSERAYGLFERLERIGNRDPEHDRYLLHDTYVGYSAAMMLGDYPTARMWSGRMNVAFATPYDGLTALRFGRFTDALRFARDDTVAGLAVRGCAALALGQIATARDAATRLRKISTSGYLAELFLARLAEREGNGDQARRWLDQAVDEQATADSGELLPLLPALEVRGELALRGRAYDDAVAGYRAALAAFPDDPRALFGLAAGLQALGRDAEAASARARFRAVWGANALPALEIPGLPASE